MCCAFACAFDSPPAILRHAPACLSGAGPGFGAPLPSGTKGGRQSKRGAKEGLARLLVLSTFNSWRSRSPCSRYRPRTALTFSRFFPPSIPLPPQATFSYRCAAGRVPKSESIQSPLSKLGFYESGPVFTSPVRVRPASRPGSPSPSPRPAGRRTRESERVRVLVAVRPGSRSGQESESEADVQLGRQQAEGQQ
jgi:hypothetical protein